MPLHELTAAGVPVEIDGRTYHLLPLRAKDWGEAARYLAARRKPPLEVVKERLSGLSESDRRVLLELAYRDERDGELLDVDTVRRWFGTPEGAAFKLWLALRRNHAEVTLDGADELLKQLSDEEASGMARSANATDGLPEGNSCGRS
jgi:hypothetical protein